MASRTPRESLTTPVLDIPGLPKYGWRVHLDFESWEKCSTAYIPRFSELFSLPGLMLRYGIHALKCRISGRRPHLDLIHYLEHKPIYGCPIGGIGGGSIGRGYRGEFCRFQMIPGRYEHNVVQADAFIVCIRKGGKTVYQKVLTGSRQSKVLRKWQWGFPLKNATYQALYPRAWTVYHIPKFNIRLVCRQISPIIPHDYKDSSFPMAVFVWTVENHSQEEFDVSIAFTFKNGTGSKDDFAGACWTKPFTTRGDNSVRGVQILQQFQNMQCTYAIAVADTPDVKASHCVQFDPQGCGDEIWNALAETGQLHSTDKASEKTSRGKDIGAGVCLQCRSDPGSTRQLEFCLVWDMPNVQFGPRGFQHTRRYSKWFGSNNDAAPTMAEYCIKNYSIWEEKIEAWQEPILSCSKLPSWYKALLFNELYYIGDGGTIWLNTLETNNQLNDDTHPLVKEYGRFGYLEGHEFRLYNTYDVHFYASFALIMLWPKIQMTLQIDIGKAAMTSDSEPFTYCISGITGPRKMPNTTPHDMGEAEKEPWVKVNSYIFEQTDNWKDLNSKFVLQVYRDYYATSDKDYLEHMYPIMKIVMETSLKWNTDGDGLIENGGIPDQTYAMWNMHGTSAYCGGLWLCALRMFVESAKILGHSEDCEYYTDIMDKAKESFEVKLWNGNYYNYDCGTTCTHDTIMADQLAGKWYMKAAGITDESIFPAKKVRTALTTVYKNNVMGFAKGNMGAINGTRPNGEVDTTSRYSEEFWTGVTYSLAANMIQEDMLEEAFQTAWGIYNVCWEWRGFMFQSPEAYRTTLHCRYPGYMRALSIWSMQWALEKCHPQLFKR